MSKKTTKTTAAKTTTKTRKARQAETLEQKRDRMAAQGIAVEVEQANDAVMAELAAAVGTPASALQTPSAGPEAKAKGNKGRKARVTPTPSSETETAVEGPTAKDLAEAAKSQGAQVIEQSAFYQVRHGSRRLYIAKSKKGVTRIDLAGFTLDHPAVEQLTEEEAKAAKIGRVRGQIFPSKADGWFEAYGKALVALMATEPSEKSKAKAAKAEVK